jgi:PAS domain S-box-containing protein
MNGQVRTNSELIEEISVLKLKIKELEQSESGRKREIDEEYRILLEESPDPFFSFTSEGQYKYVNRAFAEGVGKSIEDIIGKRIWDVFSKEEADKRFAFLSQIFRTGEEKVIEVRVPKADGDRYYVTTITPIKNTAGEVVSAICSSKNITDRKQAEDALRESEERYRSLVENAGEAIYVAQDGRLKFVNRAGIEIAGYSEQELISKPFIEFIHPDDRAMVGERYLKRLKGEGFNSRYTFRFIAKNGGIKLLELGAVLIDFEGRPATLNLVTDVTDRKRTEEALLESEELFRVSMDGAPDGVYMNDLDGYFLYGNRKAEEIIGYSREELVGRNFLDFNMIAEGSLGKAAELLKANNEGKSTGPDEIELIRKDGRHVLIEINTTVLQRRNKKDVLAFVRDITERRQIEEEKQSLEERLQRAEKMESLGLLAGGVAHDLNNVLGIVIGYAELLLRDEDHSNSIRSKLDNIMEGGQKAAAIVQDLLTLARRGVSGRKVLNLNKIIANNQKSPEFANLFFHHSAVKIKTDLEPELLNISGSSVHLVKTIFNLVSNATEAMPKGGILTIRTVNRYLDKPIQGYDEIREGDYVVLSVSDTGEGIHAADLKRIFEPFYTKKVMGRSGTGLGLAVVWGTVKDHNGYINVQSEEGKGSAFTLYFPVTREELSAEHVAVSISEYMGKGESILIVDDVKGQRDLAEEMLKKLNYIVISASSGEKAVAYLKEHKADLMVLDMIMDPGMDGLDTYRSVLEMCPKQKAIIVSGFSETERVKVAQALGAGAYVRKPYIIEKLGLAVRKELDRAT